MTSGQSGIPHLTEDELCLSGPGKEWLTHSSLPQGLEVHLVGVGQQPGWLVLSHPQFPDIKCWVPEEHIELPDPQILNGLPTIAIPPKPTPTPTPTKPPVCSPAEQQQGKCTP
jgi:hypothetical protein